MPKTVTQSAVRRSSSGGKRWISVGAAWLLIGLFIALDRHMFLAMFESGPPFLNGGAVVRFIVVVLLGPLNPFMDTIKGILNSIPTR